LIALSKSDLNLYLDTIFTSINNIYENVLKIQSVDAINTELPKLASMAWNLVIERAEAFLNEDEKLLRDVAQRQVLLFARQRLLSFERIAWDVVQDPYVFSSIDDRTSLSKEEGKAMEEARRQRHLEKKQ
jgi:hypothetical protein